MIVLSKILLFKNNGVALMNDQYLSISNRSINVALKFYSKLEFHFNTYSSVLISKKEPPI